MNLANYGIILNTKHPKLKQELNLLPDTNPGDAIATLTKHYLTLLEDGDPLEIPILINVQRQIVLVGSTDSELFERCPN